MLASTVNYPEFLNCVPLKNSRIKSYGIGLQISKRKPEYAYQYTYQLQYPLKYQRRKCSIDVMFRCMALNALRLKLHWATEKMNENMI